MESANPYSAPVSDVRRTGSEAYGTVKFFSFSGRLGRLRYLAYAVSMFLLAWLVVTLLSAVVAGIGAASGDGQLSGVVVIGLLVIVYGVMLVLSLMLAVQRIHDFNASGWLALLLLVPYVNILFGLVLWFVPGTDGENRYGLKTPPNGTGVKVLAIGAPIFMVFVIGVLAAIAIPQYQQYVERAKQAQQQPGE
ncbi:MAG TPA: DUF805 domain-containing protein [Gammaproteobacteria bacterium]